jgi:hypothetical protein
MGLRFCGVWPGGGRWHFLLALGWGRGMFCALLQAKYARVAELVDALD